MVGVVKDRYYWHDIIGYNYRMTNICAAIGLGQLKIAKDILKKKKIVFNNYKYYLKNVNIKMNKEFPHTKSSFWLINIFVKNKKTRDGLAKYLKKNKIETRNTFNPVHKMPMYKNISKRKIFSNANTLSDTGLSLPSGPSLKKGEIKNICNLVINYLGKSYFRKILP
tara:strand:- start:333 stop:833 length:501 start_codon:yes stop_codon:yes gene_type:complete